MYYPKSQIKTNLYTNGGEFIRSDNRQPYEGYYYSTSKGESYTGKTPNTPETVLLIKVSSQFSEDNSLNVKKSILSDDNSGELNVNSLDVIRYTRLQGEEPTNQPKVIIPYYIGALPIDSDYTVEEFRRYFCKKNNEIKYIEIDKPQYDLLVEQSPKILWQLYTPFYIDWQISGDKDHVENVNKNTVELEIFRKKLPKFGDYLRFDYLKYYK